MGRFGSVAALGLVIGSGGCSDVSPSVGWTVEWDNELPVAVAPLEGGTVVVGSGVRQSLAESTEGSVRFIGVSGDIILHASAPGPVVSVDARGGSTYAAGGSTWVEDDGEVVPRGWFGRFDRRGDALWVEYLAPEEHGNTQVHGVALAPDDSVVALVHLEQTMQTMVRRHHPNGDVEWSTIVDRTRPRAVAWLADPDEIAVVTLDLDIPNAATGFELSILSASGETRDRHAWPATRAVHGVLANFDDHVYVAGTIRGETSGDVWVSGLSRATPRWEKTRQARHTGTFDWVTALAPSSSGIVTAGFYNTGERGEDGLALYRIWLAEYDRRGDLRWEYDDDYMPIVPRRSELRPLDRSADSRDTAGTFVEHGTRTTDGRLVLVGYGYPGPMWARSYDLP
jgi:hypothetical protein